MVFDVYEPFRKMSFRNRIWLAGGEGKLQLSIPLEQGRDQRLPFGEVRIANRYPWQDQHWKTLCSCYNRSPWFEYYRDELEELYRQPVERLADWNRACFEWTVRKLGWTGSWEMGQSNQPFASPEPYTDGRNSITARLLEELEPVRYAQVFEERVGFIPHLSVLDLLCCAGKRSLGILQEAGN